MKVKIGSDGQKTCLVTISGQLSKAYPKPEPILFFAKLLHTPKGLRLDGVQFAIQEKMGFNLWWMMAEGDPELIMPMESRSGYNFETIQGMPSPEHSVGVGLSTFKVSEPLMSYMIMLDFTKL